MSSATLTAFEALLDSFGRCLTPDVAKHLTEMELDPKIDARLSELAEKANEGQLAMAEREEYEGYIEAMDLLALLREKARQVLEGRAA